MKIFIEDNFIRLPKYCGYNFWSDFFPIIKKNIVQSDANQIIIDFSNVIKIDSSTAAALEELENSVQGLNKQIIHKGMSSELQESFQIFSGTTLQVKEKTKPINFFVRVGEKTYNFYDTILEFLYLVSETFYWSIKDLFNSKGRLKNSAVSASVAIGVNALPIIALLSFLIGLVLGLQSAAQLRQFGANIFIVHLIGISMTREMGPLMTAIILAGRSGSAFASEIATMKVSEELDALKIMALNPVRFVVVPKFYGITLSAPLLTIVADVLGIMGGFVVAVVYLDLTPYTFFSELINVLMVWDIITSLIKSFVFAWIIVLIGSHFGFQASGGPEGVGRVTTQSVVASIFGVIVADSILGLVFYF